MMNDINTAATPKAPSLHAHFPDLDPTATAPKQISFWGIGTRLFGKRDFDSLTQSFVQTLFFTVFFVPVFALAAYRVTRRDSELLLLGSVPTSNPARKYSYAATAFLLLTIVTGIGYGYFTSEGYRNGRLFAQAQQQLRDGEFVQAVGNFKQLMVANTEYKQVAAEAVKALLSEPQLSTIPTDRLADVIRAARSVSRSFLKLDEAKLFTSAMAIVDKLKSEAPIDSHALLHSIDGLGKQTISAELDEALLRASVQQKYNRFVFDELALLLEQRGDGEGLRTLLTPHENELGDGEGARILAQLLTGAGEFERAYPLFSAYLGTRLTTLANTEKQYLDLQNSLWNAEFERLNKGNGPAKFYQQYNATPEADKQAFVNEYVAGQVNGSAQLKTALEQYRQAASIVPAALDYGMVLLQRAQTLADASAREADLQKAEATFLAVRGVAGDSDQYRLHLGQVYYWLGKQEAGHAEFDALLAKYQRNAETLLGVASTLRNIGMNSEAVALATEAYNANSSLELKHSAAHLLFLLANTLQERISWLEKSDIKQAYVAMDLSAARGHLAEQAGERAQAARHFREAIRLAESLPVNATTYNNKALVYSALARVTDDTSALVQAAALMAKAVELNPSDAILLGNTAQYLLQAGLREIYGERIDFTGLQIEPGFDELDYLYRDDAGLNAVREQVRQQPLIRQGIEYLRKAVVLAPKEARNYFALYRIAVFTEDNALLQELDAQLGRNGVDLASNNQRYLDFLNNRNQEEFHKVETQQLRHFSTLDSTTMSPLSRSLALSKLVELRLHQVLQGSKVQIGDIQTAAERAYQLAPSLASEDLLIDVLLTRASLETAGNVADYRAARSSAGRALPDDAIAALALRKGGESRQALLAHPLMTRALAMLSEQLRRFPKKTNLNHWALLSAHAEADAERIAANVRNSNNDRLARHIGEQLYPFNAYVVVSTLWSDQIEHRTTDLPALLTRFSEQQVPLPLALLN